ncbi:MAG: hypothetical protein ACKOXK_03995 [Chakrabartia sp.]
MTKKIEAPAEEAVAQEQVKVETVFTVEDNTEAVPEAPVEVEEETVELMNGFTLVTYR